MVLLYFALGDLNAEVNTSSVFPSQHDNKRISNPSRLFDMYVLHHVAAFHYFIEHFIEMK
jgi:hypothetical protein